VVLIKRPETLAFRALQSSTVGQPLSPGIFRQLEVFWYAASTNEFRVAAATISHAKDNEDIAATLHVCIEDVEECREELQS
jgi:hypothetical protein